MSIQSEKIKAQESAFKFYPKQPWHRHLIGPKELSILLAGQYDCEKIILECIPGGDTCDPQKIADNIRDYFLKLSKSK